MSKTYGRVYAKGYRAGRKATRWERFKWLLFHRRAQVEDWLTDDDAHDTDFLIVALAVTAIGVSAVMMVFASRM